MSFRALAQVLLALTVAVTPSVARADANGWITLGLGAGVTYSSAPGAESANATSFNLGARLKMLKLLGVDLSYAPGAADYGAGEPSPTLRLTALLYFLNFESFAVFGAVGLAGTDFGDLADVQGTDTHYRAGGGLELTLADHYSLGVEGYWLARSVGMAEQQMKAALEETGQVMSADEAFPTNGFELFFGVRYFF